MNSVFYHCWFGPGEPPPYCHLGTPLILSIATLRKSFTGKIYVVDLSESPQDWSYFPEKLGFEVIRHKPFFRKDSHLIRGWKHLSRIPDIHHVAMSLGSVHAVYSDCDVFWLDAPPQTSSRFTFNGVNSGFYYYKPSACSEFLDLFISYSERAINDLRFRKRLKKYCSYDGWYGVWDEMVLPFMIRRHPHLFTICPQEEHVSTRTMAFTDLAKARMFHTNASSILNPYPRLGGHPKFSPGIYALAIEEIFQRTRGVLDDDDIETIFTHTELDYFEGRRFSIFEVRNKLHLGARPGTPGHTELDCFLRGARPPQGAWNRLRSRYWGFRHYILHRFILPRQYNEPYSIVRG
jgi:hypothetical protein